MRGMSHSSALLFSLCVALGATSLGACHQKGPQAKPDVEAARAAAGQSHAELKAQVEKVQQALSEVRTRLKGLPEDWPELQPVRSKLQTLEEVQGVEDARVQWLSGELSAAASKDAVETLSGTIKSSIVGNQGVEKSVAELSAVVKGFEGKLAQSEALEAKGVIFKALLPSGTEIRAAKDGVENQLIEFIDDGTRKVDKKTWFAFDRLVFVKGEARMDLDQSRDQLDNVASVLASYPGVKLEFGSYPSGPGSTPDDKKLPGARAEAVKAALIGLGVAPARLTAEGHGPTKLACPANDTDECKAKNQRVSVHVTIK